jgi:hypothetical protein
MSYSKCVNDEIHVACYFKMCSPVANSELEVRSSGSAEIYRLDLTSGSGFAAFTGNTKH